MFKIESYVTPLILSYVDKYIKNIKPEDSQVSLWGGDAVFHNLDLRLDVLEAELHSPFTFSSGHIHELRIHVPWTKLASESIVITINTIECTLKLKSTEDRLSEKSSQSQRAKSKRQEVAVSPPGYIQSLMSKIINNISIVCNNVILKYLEEDIVLSLNARTVSLTSVDSNWETAFTELASPDFTSRKAITVSDLTICLDQCNAQGKIPTYQEPFLYRCSLTVRLSSTYPNAIGARALKTRIDFLFPKLDFSLSDQQIPMFIRLFNLALALYLGDFKNKPDKKEEADDNTSTVVDDTNVEEGNSENQSWAGWAWGYVPAILPVWENDAAESGDVLPSDREIIFQFGVFIERVNWTFKWAELIRDVSISSAPSRLRFQPFLTARMQGCFLQVTVAGIEWVDVQGGISHLMLEPSSSCCLCGVQEDTTLYYLQGCERSAFLNESLYDPIEKDQVESKLNFLWEDHVQRITEATLLERTPALGFDYLYQLELPGDITSEYLSQLGSEFEYSNLPEKALFRLAVSPLQLKVSYGLVHRLSALLHAARNYNYPDYADPELEIIRRSSIPPDTDQLLNLGSNLPSRTYQVAVLRPLVFISVTPPHPTFDIQRLVERRVIRMRDNVNSTPTVSLPVLKFACTCADLQVVRPMYPIRLTMALQSLPSPPASLIQQGHTMVQLKFQELSTELVMEECHLPLLKPCNASVSLKLLLLPEMWQTERVIFSCKMESEKLELLGNRPQIDFVTSVWKTLTDPVTLTTPNRIVLFEVLNQAVHPTLQLNLNGFRMDYIRTASMVCAGSTIRSLNASIVQTNAVPFFSHTSDPHRSNFTEWLIQFPHSLIQRKVEADSAAPVFVFKMSSFDVLLDAGWLKWLNYRSDALVENATSIGPEEETETLQPTSFRSNQSNCARDSGLSSSMDGQTWRASSFQQSTLTKSAEETSSTYEPIDWIAIRRLLQRSILHIDIQPSSLVLLGDSGELRLQFQLPAVYVSCPHVRTSSLTLEDLPFRESGSLVSSFPWTVSFQHFGFSSGLHFDSLRPILEPISLKMTIALNPSTANSPVDPVKCTDIRPPSIDLCIHIDMNAIEISLDVLQLQLLCDKFADLSNWLGISTSNSPVITTSRSNFEIGLWLQWAMPRFVLALETPSSRTVLDMEDVTTSVDYQHRQYAKIKSRLTSVSVKLFTKTEETWNLESKTNGIVMSCVDDITRDLLPSGAVGKTVAVPSISTAPSDAFQPQPASKNSVGGNAGGILTLTWTRAQRQDVHSKWHSRGRRKSNQTEEEVEEIVSPSDRYLHEVDIALEAIDVVLTEILLDHLIQLAQPALNSLSRILTPTSTLPASSHTLPLIFATSKGLRVFLVQEKFLLLNLDGAELSPHVQNPVGRSVQLKPDLYDEAERQGLLFIPGHDVEDRQYQIDLSGLSFSSGCWREVERASWVWRTLNPASTLHTMAENPALEWNARQEHQPSEPSVGLTPILARCSLRIIYAPPIVSLEQQCLVAGQAIEVSASSDIQLLIDAKQIDYYIQWMNILLTAATNLSSKEEQVAGFPAHSFFTCNRVCVIIYTSKSDEFLPFALINLIQPHVLIKTADQEVHEMAVYDIRLQLPCWADGSPVKSCLLPDESMYPISLIETRLGQPSILTGVPPSLFRLEIISARQLNVELGRPFKFILHADNISTLQYLARQLEDFQTKQEDSKPSLYRQISLKTSQMVVEIPVPSAVIIVGLNDMLLDVTCQFDTNEEKREKLEANLILNAFSVKAEMDENINLQLCDPFSLNCRIQLLWPHWLSNKRVLVHAFCRADNLRLHAGPRQVTVATAFRQWMLENYSPSQNENLAQKNIVVDKDEQHYQDDLRTGAFDFQVRDNTSRPSSEWLQAEEKPRPYQVVFNVQPASMCWAYPQPRALTRVDVYPIPLMKADGAGQDAAPGVEQVDCTLEFWDHCSQEFRILRRFSLSEVRFTRVPLPSISTNQTARNVQRQDDEKRAETGLLEKQVTFSDMWRIVMHFTEENLPENRPKKIIAAPPSLVACTRIDSYFNASMVPDVQLGFTFNHISLSLRNQLITPPSSSLDGQFHLDGTMPTDFPFATINCSSISANLRCRLDETSVTASLDFSTQVQANLINFRFLVDESILEPTSVDVKILLDESKFVTAFISSHRSLDFNIGQCSVHTLTSCLNSWNALLNTDSHLCTLYTHYVIRNDTQNVLRVGQSGTGESILLASRQAHQYAWKVMDENNQLHACMEGGRWRWCQPCSIDRLGTTIRSVVDSRPKLPLIWTVKALNSLQKEVTIRGQVQIANLLPHALEIKLIPSKMEPSGAIVVGEMRGQVSASSIAPSFVFPLEHLHAVKVRLPGNTWSGLIPLVQVETKTRNVLLVRVAQKDKGDSLNLWCHMWSEKVDQHHSRLLVLFSPLYMVRSYLPQPLRLHLRTPGLNSSLFSEIEGRGSQSVLECPGSVDHGHQLSFQLSSTLPESTPPVPLSWTMASQNVTLSGQQTPYINDLLEELFTNDQLEKWPFAENVDFIDCSADIPQPKTDVRVTFSSVHQRCHSLLVELKPWALVVNHSGIDLVLKRVNDSAGCWTLPNRAVMAPPPMNDDTFQIGFIEDGQLDSVFYSQPLLLQDQDHFHFMYRPRVEGAIPLEGFCTVQITKSNGAMCYLTLTSRMHEGIRILSIQPTFRVHNATPSLLKIGCLIGDSLLACKPTLVEPKDESRAIPLLFWQSTGKHSESLYLSIRLCSDWSCPIQLYHPGHSSRNSNSHHINPQRYSVSVPLSCGSLESETSDNCPLVITRLEQSGLVYLSVNVDPDPLWVLINRTELTLAYGQASDSVPGHPEPDCPNFNWHGVIRSNEAAFYTPPWGQLRYTDVSPPVNLPRLLLGLEETSPKWSNPVHPSHTYDQFLCLSPNIDVMVRMVRTSTPNQTAIYIEPVSRVEISASDIRGRIEIPPPVAPPSPVQDVTIRPPRPALRSPCKTDHECKVLHNLAGNQLVRITNTVSEEKDLNLTVYWPEISICFRDDTTSQRREMSRLTVDHFLVDYFQNSSVRRITSRCGHVQMDNQLYQPQSNTPEARSRDEEVQGFDFPVIFLAQNPPTWQHKSLAKLLDVLRQSALVVLELGLTDSGRPTSLDFQLDPIFLFIEDRFIVSAMDYLNTFSFSSPTLKKGSNQSSELVSFPDRVAEVLSSLSVSVNLDQLKVRAISLDLSLRSSVKLYIALDHSPLRLDAFERSLVLTTPYRLGQTLAMHYVSSALFKAGWVVGSMELLGSPTALARTVTLGLKDFVRLPYQGIWRGPRGFLAGIFNGSASLVSHVTAGTVTSVTQLASSVARNVDRLSFDLDFQQRSEEGRRKKPQGLVQGIGWGLSALGLSLLGALGGLAHHPLQSLIEDGTVSPRGLAVGLTKGIVGVVAKPISGAADLVAQTGQGLLSATQWNEPFQARRPQLLASNQLDLICSGPTKILWKLNDETPPLTGHHTKASRICCCLEAMRARVNDALPIREQLAPVILLVSTQNFCVLNAEDGEVQVVLDLNEVDCWAHKTDPTLILVRPTPLSAPVLIEARRDDDFNPHYDYQRVSEFVRLTTPYFLPEAAVETIQDMTANQTSSIATMEFFLNPTTKDFFIQCFQMAKQQRKGVGFALL